jgi:hypothetical protein
MATVLAKTIHCNKNIYVMYYVGKTSKIIFRKSFKPIMQKVRVNMFYADMSWDSFIIVAAQDTVI